MDEGLDQKREHSHRRSHKRKREHRDRDRERDGERRHRKSRRHHRDEHRHRHSRRRSSRERSSRERSSPRPRRERKSRNWDKAPEGFEGMSVAQVAQINPSVLMPFIATQTPQQTRQARRLYIGNIPAGISEHHIIQFFNTAMLAARANSPAIPDPQGGALVVGCQLNPEKSFAFVEFNSSETATAGMALDGITLQGQSLKVRRPRDYQPAGPGGFMPHQIPGIVSTNVPDTPDKIFVGGIPAYLNEEQVKDLLSSFGPLRSFNLVKDSTTGNSKGYAFYEYADASVTDEACAGLNGMKLGDKTLLVQRADIGKQNQTPALLQMPPSLHGGPGSATASSFLNLSIPAAALLNNLFADRNTDEKRKETSVLQLLNMVNAEDLVEDDEYEGILADVGKECKNYGQVVAVVAPRPDVIDGKIAPNNSVHAVGRVFVQFSSVDDAKCAQQALAGRRFCGRTVLTSFFDENNFANRRFA